MLKTIKSIVPPFILDLVKKHSGYILPAQWEYMPKGFVSDIKTGGWNVQSVVDAQVTKWPQFEKTVKSNRALGINHEAADQAFTYDLIAHNLLLSYGYVLLLAANQKNKIAVLDWGGGIGHYGAVSEALLQPAEKVQLSYHCYDLPLFCEAGAQLNPQFSFFSDPGYIKDKKFDLVLASSSLWYEKDWKSAVQLLAASCSEYLYITRMNFIVDHESYVAIQRPGILGFKTEYLCWILNQHELTSLVESLGFTLVREIFICDSYPIFKAPEQGKFKGFLFRKI